MFDRRIVVWLGAMALTGKISFAVETRDLMPVPESVAWKDGALPVDARFTLGASGPADGRVQRALARAAEWLQREAKLPKAPGVRKGAGTLSVVWKNTGSAVQGLAEEESYDLTVDARGVHLSAPNPLGVLRGLETLKQLVRGGEGTATVAYVEIKDRPRFAWRGLLLDPCRHWEPVEVVKRTLDGMAAVKMNVLHWHLSDEQGFRMESRKFPKLTEPASSDGKFYTQAQVKDVIAYARDRGIRVVPEFDMPGHTTSILVAYPELGLRPGPYELKRQWQTYDTEFDPSKDEVYPFALSFWTEMAGLFPDQYAHIGGDEVVPKQWNADPHILTFINEHGLRDYQDLQAYFNKKLADVLLRLDKKMVGWDEVLHPDLPPSAVVQSWRGVASLGVAAKLGHDAILSAPYYLDHMLSAATHYAADPIPEGSDLTPEQKQHILGGEACMWGEYVDAENIDTRIWPRTAAIAERLWSPADVKDVADMYRRLEIESGRLARIGLTHRAAAEAKLARLAGDQPVAPLRRLASLVEPVKLYQREELRTYDQSTPLDRFVDAVLPDSEGGRLLEASVGGWLAGVADVPPLRPTLDQWKTAMREAEPVVAANPKLTEVRTLPKDIVVLMDIGHKCLDYHMNGWPVDRKWVNDSWLLMDAMDKPRGEVQIAVVHAVRKMLIATWNGGKLKDVPRAEWNRWVEDEIKRIQAEQKPSN